MTSEAKNNPPRGRPILLSPWLVVLGALVLYGLTLNHWVTLRSLQMVSQITGWDWHPLPTSWRGEPIDPLFLVLTYPFRLLPVAWQPVCLNAFTALCAALTLGLLALSVRLLPHDRTRDQRLREGGEFALLSIRAAFLPPLFAVLMLGLQLTFWQHAVSATGEMVDLLVFAFLIFCVLRFRISQNDSWLLALAFVYGLGVTSNWALIGFFPLFFMALIWIKGFGFFNLRFIALMSVCGAAGLLLYLLAPALGSLGGDHDNFWYMLREEVGSQTYYLRMIPRYVVLVAGLATILPLIFAGVRWPSFLGEVSAVGNMLTQFMIEMLHVVFLVLPLVTLCEFKFSPSARMREMPNSFLTFYYVAALCVGYFSGYLLLIFGRRTAQSWERPGPARKFLNGVVVAVVWALAFAAPIGLACQNFPRLQASNSPVLTQFADYVLDGLPPKDAIVLSDDAARLTLLEGAYQRRHLSNQNFLIETGSLAHREYIRYLTSRYPELNKEMTLPGNLPPVLATRALERFMFQIGRTHQIYYLHTSFGYYFEEFYLKPHGLVYELKSYPNNSPQAPLPTEAEIKAEQNFWSQLENGPLKTLPALAKLDTDPEIVSTDYSVDLDYWGIELQRADHLKEAHTQFAEAVEINPDNYIAKINLQYNDALQKGDHRPIDSSELFDKALLKYRGLVGVLKLNGPPDEPDMDLQVGEMMAESGNLRQAATLFTRRLELLPNDPEAELDMAKTYADRGKLDLVTALTDKLRSSPKIKRWDLIRVQAMAYLAVSSNSAAETLLKNAIKEDPTDEIRVGTLADLYRRVGYEALHRNQVAQARAYFKSAVTNIDLEVKLMSAAHHSGEEDASLVPTLLKRAEMEVMLGSMRAAVTTLNEVLNMQPDNTTALLNRAVAEVQLKQLKAAKADFKALGQLMPQQRYVVDFHMADVASLENNIPEEIRCLKRYLRAAPEETMEYTNVQKRLQTLESH
jgi:tetratricopeptide (TPR) repeat protein